MASDNVFDLEEITRGVRAVLITVAALLSGYLVGKAFGYGKRALRTAAILQNMPKAPGQVFLLGHSLQLLRGCPWELMHKWVLDRWPVVHVQIFNMAFVVVGSAEGLKRVFQTGQRAYVKDVDMSFKPFMGILGTGLVTSHGAHWQQQRVKVGPVLRHDMLEDVADIAHAATARLCKKLEQAKASSTAVEMEEEFRKLTLQIIGQAFLSLPPEECDKVFPKLYLPLMTEGNQRSIRRWKMYLPTPSWFRYRYLLSQLDSYVIGLLKERWEAHQRGEKVASDLLQRRIEGIMERGEQWNSATQVQLCYEFKTFLLAGHETSAAMLTWTLFELSQHPDKYAKVLAESKQALKHPTNLRKGADGMQYTLACLKETLRKYTVVPVVTRQAAEDDNICGYKIPKGAYIACLLSAVHEAEWENPQLWEPARFLPGGEYESFEENLRPYKYVPFIAGPRNCLGQNFALLEARMVLAVLLENFKFEPQDASPQRTQYVIPVGPKAGMHMYVN